MEVFGLPKTAEAVLTTLLTEREVSSWKVAGDGDSTVFILRFNSTQRTTGQPPLHGSWRRKPPCAIQRDRRRAELRRQGQERTQPHNTDNSSSNNDNHGRGQVADTTERKTAVESLVISEASDILLPLPSKIRKDMFDSTRCVSHPVTQDTQPTTRDSARDSDELMETGQACSSASDVSQTVMLVNMPDTCTGGNSGNSGSSEKSASEKTIKIEKLAIEAGIRRYDVDRCVKDITDMRTKTQLCDETRNKIFRKVVLDRRDNREVLVGESDDIIMTYDCQRTGSVLWYVTHGKQPPDPFVVLFQGCLKSLPPADEGKYQREKETMLMLLQTLCHLLSSALN